MKEKLHRSGETGTVQFCCFTQFDLLYPKTHPSRYQDADLCTFALSHFHDNLRQ